MSITEFAMLFVPFYPKKASETEESIDRDRYEEQPNVRRSLIMLSDDNKMVVRNVPAVVRVPYFIALSNPENIFYSLLVQYTPYSSEMKLFEGIDSAKDVLLARENRLKEMNRHMHQH
ncbi:ATP-dependent DNA helicase [Trichonephila clavata]|uniref:ATP-dependent DNA helicase n=1 Tax=Trichonephila clavata TaxID=2740835 RepID=A0A8X6KMD2_TRICU|nr:ATP-dependent DNA helicase [Trichonephila clavata]